MIDVCLLEMEMSLRGLFEGFAFIMWTYMHHLLITLPSCRFCFFSMAHRYYDINSSHGDIKKIEKERDGVRELGT